jgi:hypothetical protein
MSLYQRYTSKPESIAASGFKLDSENISYYLSLCDKLDQELKTLKSYIDIEDKLENPEKQDYLYTPEYLNARMAKLKPQMTFDDNMTNYISRKKELDRVNTEIKVVFPKVMDKDLGRDPLLHQQMSGLNDRRKQLEDEMVSIISSKYQELRDNLPKIFFMIFEGVDMDTVHRCFNNMASVLRNGMSVEEGAEDLMKFSEKKYGLPSSLYDPIRGKGKSKTKGKK